MSAQDITSWDYTVLTRWWAQITSRITSVVVPTSAKTNPAYVTFMDFLRRTENLTVAELKENIINFPANYRKWWYDLWVKDPVHLVVETCLVIFIFWLLLIRKTADPKKKVKDGSSFTRSDISNLASWSPEPLVPALTAQQVAQNSSQVNVTGVTADGKLLVEGVAVPVLNLSSYDYLGLSSFESVKASVQAALEKYGCGSCGPRGFYGTIDVHLEFEQAIAEFMGQEEAIAYSDSASGVTSTISAFAKKGDLILMDEACHEAIRTGVRLSRATVRTYKHNDMADLSSILAGIDKEDKDKKRDTLQQRRFIVTEGVFRNTGAICNLPQILQLKEKFFYRLILDESQAFGTLGATGRGTTEHFNVKITDVEIVTIAMDCALASVGGVCIGTREVVDHQRLSGPGYCFSASACPFISAAAKQSLMELKADAGLLGKLRNNAQEMAALLTSASASAVMQLKAGNKSGDAQVSPMMHVQLSAQHAEKFSREEQKAIILRVARIAMEKGTGVTACKFSLTDLTGLAPSCRVCVSAQHTSAQLAQAARDLTAAFTAAIAERGAAPAPKAAASAPAAPSGKSGKGSKK
jgi:serine palmitoyltransferase